MNGLKKLILINGPAGSGKTTISLLLNSTLENSFLIESDALIKVNPWIVNDKLTSMLINNAASLINNFVNEGYTTGIVTGGITTQNSIDSLLSQIHSETTTCYYWINADKNVRMKRKQQRARDAADNIEHFAFVDSLSVDPGELIIPNGNFKRFDSTSNQLDEIVKEILCDLTA